MCLLGLEKQIQYDAGPREPSTLKKLVRAYLLGCEKIFTPIGLCHTHRESDVWLIFTKFNPTVIVG